jgi:hypothetical protein
MSLSHEDFLKMQVLGEAIYKLHTVKSNFHHLAKTTVQRYVRANLPQHVRFIDDACVDFTWCEDGITVSYDYEADGFGFMDGPEKRSEYFHLKYKDVFGWEVNFTKGISAKWGYDYITNLVNSFRPQPPAINFDI